ncbi:RNA 2'-phosphotransferase [Marinicrinis sediminis]|uniref:Probable RNA 2'-phosphotransferase n=1 Tax=Marinicrinis sediminis TaxID=1652465 RepID=A0ABW5R7H4_9BACL
MSNRELSKQISYALRHAPWEFELELDENGWVRLEQLLSAFRLQPQWQQLEEADIRNMINHSPKQRHEMKDGKIRALYGHTLSKKMVKEQSEPPPVLYHGTANRFMAAIEREGLLPSGRQYVHMSADQPTARIVGKRKDPAPVLLQIDARQAHMDGYAFYLGNDTIWLADQIPPRYLKRMPFDHEES